MVGTTKVLVILMMSKMPCLMEGFGDSEGGGNKAVKWSPYKEEFDGSNSSGFELIATESGSIRKEGRYASPVRNLVLDGTGSSYVVPVIRSYASSKGEKNKAEPLNADMYLYAAIISRRYGAVMFYDLCYQKMNGDYNYQECKR